MTKKTLHNEIESILRSYFVDKDENNHWGTPERVSQLEELFYQTLEEIVGEDEHHPDSVEIEDVIRNQLRSEILKKVGE